VLAIKYKIVVKVMTYVFDYETAEAVDHENDRALLLYLVKLQPGSNFVPSLTSSGVRLRAARSASNCIANPATELCPAALKKFMTLASYPH
jgi:hypothetical protein